MSENVKSPTVHQCVAASAPVIEGALPINMSRDFLYVVLYSTCQCYVEMFCTRVSASWFKESFNSRAEAVFAKLLGNPGFWEWSWRESIFMEVFSKLWRKISIPRIFEFFLFFMIFSGFSDSDRLQRIYKGIYKGITKEDAQNSKILKNHEKLKKNENAR